MYCYFNVKKARYVKVKVRQQAAGRGPHVIRM
jgi:hypothetical protein